jgi:dTDP-4-dehydrorhamnose reductase
MKILVTGATGFIGRHFVEAFSAHETIGLGFSRQANGTRQLDLRDREATLSLLNDIRPQIVIHCAARPTVDWCEANERDAYALNVVPTISLAEYCNENGAKLAFLSSDYVFDGEAGPYSEDDRTNPINVYGRLKLTAESEIGARLENHVNIRTTNLYGFDLESKNFLMPLLPRLAEGQTVKVAGDQWGNPTLVSDFCEAVRDLVLSDATGVFHVVGPDWMNRVEWLQTAATRFGLDPKLVEGVATSDLKQPAPRPLKSGLSTHRLERAIGRNLIGLNAGLDEMFKAWGGSPPIAEW